MNGLVFPDGAIQPEIMEAKYVQSPVKIKSVNAAQGKITIRNKNNFQDLSHLELKWTITANGKLIEEGSIKDLPIAAQQEKQFELPITTKDFTNSEYYLNCYIMTKDATSWSDKGHLIAWDQFEISPYHLQKQFYPPTGNSQISILRTRDSFEVSGDSFKATINSNTGLLTSYTYKDKTLISGGPQHNFWRAPLDNDLGGGDKSYAQRWRSAGLHKLKSKVDTIYLTPGFKNKITVITLLEGDNGAIITCDTEYSFYGNGMFDVRLAANFNKEVPFLPRAGIQWFAPDDFSNIKWYGRGPFENYIDRKDAALIGLYEGTVQGQYVPYPLPQENGNKTAVRWVSFQNDNGVGFTLVPLHHMNISAHLYTQENLTEATHTYELENTQTITINIDHKMMGVGGDDSWNPRTKEAYLIAPIKQQYTIRFIPEILN